MKRKNFFGFVFPDVTDIHGLGVSEEAGVLTYEPDEVERSSWQADGNSLSCSHLYLLITIVSSGVSHRSGWDRCHEARQAEPSALQAFIRCK